MIPAHRCLSWNAHHLPTGRAKSGIALNIVLPYRFDVMDRAIYFDHQPQGPNREINGQAFDADLPPDRIALRTQLAERLPSLLLRRVRAFTKRPCAPG